MSRKNKQKENYLEKIPVRSPHLSYTVDESGLVTLSYENKGIFNRIFQIILKKPKISYVHLDEIGSVVWPLIDGKKSIMQLGEFVRDKCGDRAEPLYARLAKYFQILESYKFIKFVK